MLATKKEAKSLLKLTDDIAQRFSDAATLGDKQAALDLIEALTAQSLILKSYGWKIDETNTLSPCPVRG